MGAKVAVVVLNFKGKQHLRDCFESIFAQTFKDFEALLMDQGEGDGSDALVKEAFPQVKIIRNPDNLGTAGGFNFACRGLAHEYLFFLANDTKLARDALEKLMKSMEDPETGIASVKMLDFYHPEIIDQLGFNVDFMGFPAAIGRYEQDTGQYAQPFEAVPTGTGLLIRNQIFQRLGGFDDAFFTLQDEVDLAWRAQMLGYICVVNPQACLYHKISATLKNRRRWYLRFLSERNTLRLLLKNYTWFNLIWVLPVYSIVLIAEFVYHIVTLRIKIALSLPLAVLWNMYKLPSTLRQRRHIQKIRTVGDAAVLKKRVLRSYKLRIFWHVLTRKAQFPR